MLRVLYSYLLGKPRKELTKQAAQYVWPWYLLWLYFYLTCLGYTHCAKQERHSFPTYHPCASPAYLPCISRRRSRCTR